MAVAEDQIATLSSDRLRKAFAAGRTASSSAGREDLYNRALPMLQRVLRADSVALFEWSDENDRPFRGVTSHDLPADALSMWTRDFQAIDPLLKHCSAQVKGQMERIILSSDVVPRREFVQTRFYREFLAPFSIHHIMQVGLYDGQGDPFAILRFHRSQEAPAFSARAVYLAELAAPHFSDALLRLRAGQSLAESNFVVELMLSGSAEEGVALLDRRLNILYASPLAEEIIENDPANSGETPVDRSAWAEVLRRCKRLRRETGGLASTSATVELDTYAGTREIEVRYLRGDGEESEGQFVVKFGAETKSPTCRKRLSGYGITRREGDIVRLVVRGFTNAEIAEQLCISLRTVENHLRSLYSKVGVNSRTGLVFKLGQ